MQNIQKEKEKRKIAKEFENLDNIIKQNENEARRIEKLVAKKKREEENEKRKQEQVGEVGKAKVLGRFKYSQRKKDFQLGEQLSGNLRQMKPLGNSNLLEDRFDSIFRRSLVEPDAPTQNEKRRQKKQRYK